MKLEIEARKKDESISSYMVRLEKKFRSATKDLQYNNHRLLLKDPQEFSKVFKHITSSFKDGFRLFDEHRAKYILNVTTILKNASLQDEILKYTHLKDVIIYNLEKDHDFLIVLNKIKRGYYLKTAFHVNSINTQITHYKNNILDAKNIVKDKKINFTQLYKLNNPIKDIYIDEDVSDWLKYHQSWSLFYRIIALSIKSSHDEIYLMVPKNASFHKNDCLLTKKTITMHLYDEGSKINKKLNYLISEIIDKINDIQESNSSINEKFIKLYDTTLEDLFSLCAAKDINNVFKKLKKSYGYETSSIIQYKFKTQFYLIYEALKTKNKEKIRFVAETYKLSLNDDAIMIESELNNYIKKYFLKFWIVFKETVVG